MSTILRLELPWPPSANKYWVPAKGRGLVPSHEAIRYKEDVAKICRTNGVRPIRGKYSLAVTFCPPKGKPQRDLENGLKVLSDALNTWAFEDDKYAEEISLTWGSFEAGVVFVRVTGGEGFLSQEEADALRLQKATTAAKRRATARKNRIARVLQKRLRPAYQGNRLGP